MGFIWFLGLSGSSCADDRGAAARGLQCDWRLWRQVTRGAATRTATAAAAANETTTSENDLRTGWDPDEPELTPANVAGRTPGYTFGQVFRTAVTGQVYAQPLVIGSTVIVATEQDYVYGLNASTGAVQWQTSLGTPYQITTCSDLAPDIGVTGGPVYDPATGDVYLVAQTVTRDHAQLPPVRDQPGHRRGRVQGLPRRRPATTRASRSTPPTSWNAPGCCC